MNKITDALVAFLVVANAAMAQTPPPTGILRDGGVILNRTETRKFVGPDPGPEAIHDGGAAAFLSTDYTNYTPPPSMVKVTTVGPCTISDAPSIAFSIPSLPPSKYLDSGKVINLNGPNGMAQLLPAFVSGSFVAELGATPTPGSTDPAPVKPYLDPGPYAIDNGDGGSDVGPFTASLTIPSFAWTNANANQTIDRSAGVDLEWTVDDPSASIVVSGAVNKIDPTTFRSAGIVTFSCTVPNTGTFTLSPDVLSLLPASSTNASGFLAVASNTQVAFSAAGIDNGLILYTAANQRNVVYQ